MRLGTKNFHAVRLAGGLGLMLVGAAMLTGCMSADRRANTTNPPTNSTSKTAKANTNNSSQSNANNSSATGSNANVATNQNNGNQIPAINPSGLNATNNNAANGTNNTANGTPGLAPLGRPTGSNSTYNPIPGNNMNTPPQFGGSVQQTGAVAQPNANGLQPIATSATTPNRGNPPIQGLNGPVSGHGGLPPLDAVPSAGPTTSQRPVPPAVSMQNSDKTLNFPPNAPLTPGPTVNPGPVNSTPVNPNPINLAPVNNGPAGQIAPLP